MNKGYHIPVLSVKSIVERSLDTWIELFRFPFFRTLLVALDPIGVVDGD